MHHKACRSRGGEDRPGRTTSRRGDSLACVMIASLTAVLSCSAAGTAPATRTSPDVPNPIAPTSSAQDGAQDQTLKAICEGEKVDVSVNKCREYYSTYPTGFVVDAATEIYDKSGKHVDSCGGNRFFASDQAREEAERKCATYLVDCTRVVESCRSRR